MIQIQVYTNNVEGGRAFAKLFPNTRINFVIDNLAIQSLVTPGEYTLPISFPRHCINDVLFDFVHELPKNNRKSEFPVRVFFDGTPLYTGTLVIRETGINHEGHIKIQTAGLASLNRKLKDIDYGGDIDLGATQEDRYTYLDSLLALGYPDTTFNLPMVHNPRFYDGKNNAYLGYMNLYDVVNTQLARNNIDATDRDDNNPNNRTAIVPMPYLAHIVKRGFNMDDIKVAGAWVDDSDFQKILIHNNRSLDYNDNKYNVAAYQPIAFPAFTTDTVGSDIHTDMLLAVETSDPDNVFNTVTYEYDISNEGFHTFQGFVVADVEFPQYMSVRMFARISINGVFPATPVNGVEYYMLFNSAAIATSLIDAQYGYYMRRYFSPADVGSTVKLHITFYLDSNTSGINPSSYTPWLTKLATAVIRNESIALLNQLPEVLNLQNHVPDITFGALLQAYQASDNLKFSYDLLTNKVTIGFAEEAFTLSAMDITDMSEPDHSIELTFDKYKSFNYEIDSTDEVSEDKTDQPFDDTVSGDVDTVEDLAPGGATNRSLFYVKNMNMFVKAQIEPLVPVTWIKYSHGFPDFILNTEGYEIIAKNQPVYMGHSAYPFLPVLCLVPKMLQVGSTLAYNIGDNKFNLRQMYYHQMQPQQYGLFSINQATSSNMAYDGTILGDRTMYWHKETGHIEKFYAKWVKALNTGEPVTINIHLKPHQLINFNIYQRFRYHNREFLMKKMELGIDDNITPCKAEMVLLKL